jgi:proton-translocating NAD(P)+ transhydrogenase subunit beta
MGSWLNLLFDLLVILLLIVGIRLFRGPKGARAGNMINALALLAAFLLVLYRYKILSPGVVVTALLAGSAIGVLIAMRVNMIQIPAMVAFQHGAGGVAAFLVSLVELSRSTAHLTAFGKIAGVLGLIIGAATFSGSMIASAKLANKINQRPTVLPQHSALLSAVALLTLVLGGVAAWQPVPSGWLLLVLLALAILMGVLFSIRIGGADMPVLISFLNATAGAAAAFCGAVIQERLLIACGATVAASGSILTHVMCKAMNRSLLNIFVGTKSAPASPVSRPTAPQATAMASRPDAATEAKPAQSPQAAAVEKLRAAHKVVIIPGYGMALAQAQFKVIELARRLEQRGVEVKFAVHPVAGRMPGHMNVLLAEADVDYDKLVEMDVINPEFKSTDVALIVGSCDVVNPAAIQQEGTPISGMPILMAQEAKSAIVCNLDERPGYSGVENPLYQLPTTILLFGDAKITLSSLLEGLAG